MSDHPKVRLLRYIAENQPATVKCIKQHTGMSVGSIYHHLHKLKGFVAQDRSKRYLVTEYGINYMKSEENNDVNVKPVDTVTGDIGLTGDKRRNILALVGQKGLASVKEMKQSLQMSVGSLYHHLYLLKEEGLITQSADRKYALTVKSFNLIKSGIAISPSYVEVAGSSNTTIENIEKHHVDKKKRAQTLEEMLNHPKVKLLQYINEVGQVRIPDIKYHFGVSKATVRAWLKRLKDYLTTDQYGRYILNEKGKSIIDSLNDKDTLEKFLYEMAKEREVKVLHWRFASPLPLRKQRNVYDLIAAILKPKDGIVYQSRVMRSLGISYKNTVPLLTFIEAKGFIEHVDRKSLPEQYSRMNAVAGLWKVTDKGRDYLQRYNSLLSTLV